MFSPGQSMPRWGTWTEKSSVRTKPIFPLKRVDQERDMSPLLKRLRLDSPCSPCICGECISSYSRRCLSGNYMGVYHPGHQIPYYSSEDYLHNRSSSSREPAVFLSHPQENLESYTCIRRPRIESTPSPSSGTVDPKADADDSMGEATTNNGVTTCSPHGSDGQDGTWKNERTGRTLDNDENEDYNQDILTSRMEDIPGMGSTIEDVRMGMPLSSAAIEERKELLRSRFQEEMTKYRQEVCRRSSGTPIRPCLWRGKTFLVTPFWWVLSISTYGQYCIYQNYPLW